MTPGFRQVALASLLAWDTHLALALDIDLDAVLLDPTAHRVRDHAQAPYFPVAEVTCRLVARI